MRFAFYPRRHVKSVSGGTHGSFFKRSLLLDTMVAKATQRQTTTPPGGPHSDIGKLTPWWLTLPAAASHVLAWARKDQTHILPPENLRSCPSNCTKEWPFVGTIDLIRPSKGPYVPF